MWSDTYNYFTSPRNLVRCLSDYFVEKWDIMEEKVKKNWTFWIFKKACQNRVFPGNLDFFAATIYPLKRRWGGSSKFFSRKWKVWSSQGLKDNFLWQNITMTVTKIEKKILASGRLGPKGLIVITSKLILLYLIILFFHTF